MMYSRVTPVVLFTIFCLSVTGAYLNEGRQSLKHPAAMSEAKMQALDLYYTEMKLALQVGDNGRFEELITRQVLDMVTDDVDSFEVDVLPQPYQELRDLMLKGSVASAQAFLTAHPDLDLNAPQGRYGAVPIIWATGHMDAVPSMMKLLLAHGADPKVRSERGYNVLHAAASPFNYFAGASDAENMLKLLPAELVAGTTQTGLTPLHLALLNGQPELAISLLAHGADPDAPPPSHVSQSFMPGYPPLMIAGGDVSTVQALLAAGADPTAVNASGRSIMDVVSEGAIAAERDLQERISASAAEASDREYAADYARARDIIRAALDGRLAGDG